MSTREVELSGGAPWGFRMHGGADQHQPLRISRVNPGRKASLSGIREGDVISSINGRPTKGMSNADAHAMLRSAGPLLRLGLNEDRELSPRRRSIGKGSELKRPSQLIADGQKATPQAPVYATIRPAPAPHNRPSPSPLRSMNSLPTTLTSTPLVRAAIDDPPRFHPTNPFYTTLPSHTSASKLPVPNGRASISSLDRNKSKDNDYGNLQSPSFFTSKYVETGPTSMPYFASRPDMMNGYESGASNSKSTANDSTDPFSYSSFSHYDNQSLPSDRNSKNPFEPKRNSDPFEKYLRPDGVNGTCGNDAKNIPISLSDNNFHRNEEVTKRSTITEHKISEVEEVKTVKKIILNGSGDTSERRSEREVKENTKFSSPINTSSREFARFEFNSQGDPASGNDSATSPRKEHVIRIQTPTEQKNNYSPGFDQRDDRPFTSYSQYQSTKDYYGSIAEAPQAEVSGKPPVKSPARAASPTKRE